MLISVLLVASVVAIVGFGVALALRSRREFAEQNEVVPGHRSPAPASWAGAHTPEAKLHRRLGDAVRAARAQPRLNELGLTARVLEIEQQALAIDERLVAAAALPAPHRDEAVARLEPSVAALEAAVAKLVEAVSVEDSKELLEQTISDADLRLRALAEARAEVERIDRGHAEPIDPRSASRDEPGSAAPGSAP